MKKILLYLPGIGLALLIAFISQFLENLLPIHIIGGSVIALFIGMFLNTIIDTEKVLKDGIRFTSKRLLKFAIILFGASLNINMVLSVGKLSIYVMVFTLLTCFGAGYFIGKALGLNWKMSNLISAGTGICGGSAIAAIAPVIEAEDTDIAYAMSATFLFDMLMIVAFPIMGRALGLSDMAYGLWTGTAVNDTSSVVAAGFAYSDAAGDFATMVKLTRTLSIIPVVLIFRLIHHRLEVKKLGHDYVEKKFSITSIIPYFILGFLIMVGLNSMGFISESLSNNLKVISKFLMVAALAAIGLNTKYRDMKKAGINPMIHGFIISLLVVIVAIAVIYAMGLV
ncbi:putative sulfate exporter family transporter [uncultured Anaerococcus sp.]|uniref:YeiH family protein n=1 Tax=uncultured Anaerococcus sp. TaxID=293428 RepID=UPI00288AB0C7|nr:putative sulfate exporter family transporter [uncultured Anaerococcus sp.]